MAKATLVPVAIEEPQNWAAIEKRLRPMLAGVEPEGVDRVLARVQIVFENCSLGLDWSMPVDGYRDHAKWARIKGVIDATRDFYQRVIFGLLYEIALRELELMRAKRNNPPSSTADK